MWWMLLLPLTYGESNHQISQISRSSVVERSVVETYPTVYNGSLSQVEQVARISGSGGSCSATLVSKNVLVTAAHCVRGRTETLSARFVGERPIRIRCTKSEGAIQNPPSSSGGMSNAAVRNDLAACVIEGNPKTTPPACVGKPLSVGEKAKLIGFGMSNSGTSTFSDGQQRTGEAPVVSRSGGIVTTYSRGLHQNGDSALGAGDSGGFSGRQDRSGQLWISAVNSASSAENRSNGYSLNRDANGSYADLMSELSQKFLKQWAREEGVKICGVNTNLSELGGTPEPTPPNNPNPNPTPPTSPDRENFKVGIQLKDSPASAGVESVVPQSVADRDLKLKPGDRIIGFNGNTVGGNRPLRDAIRRFLGGSDTKARFQVARANGSVDTVETTLPSDSERRKNFIFGIQPSDVPEGAAIDSVFTGSNGSKYGLKAGDIITEVNGSTAKTAQQAVSLIKQIIADKTARTLVLTVRGRDGAIRKVSIPLPSAS